MRGFIIDHRKEINSAVWSMPPLYHRTWQWLKYNVNHETREIPMRDGTAMRIKRGQRLTSVRDLAKSIGWWEGTKWKEPNPKTVSTILEWMEKTGMITIERGQGNRQYTLITLVKYEEYQEKSSEGNARVTASTQCADINNNDNNENKKPIVAKPDLPYSEIIFYLNEKTNQKYRSSSKKTQECIRARFKEGFTLEDFKTVIDKKCAVWLHDKKMAEYLRPETLFGTKFEGYLNSGSNVVQLGQAQPVRPEPKYGVYEQTQEELEMMPRG